MEMGLIGKIFGGGSEKTGNIAAACLILCFILLVLVLWTLPDTTSAPKYEIVTALIGIITLTLGYLFGKG